MPVEKFIQNQKFSAEGNFVNEKKIKKRKNALPVPDILTKEKSFPIWLSISESSKLGGIQTKTIRRAIKSGILKYKIVSNRYLIEVSSLIIYLHTTTKLKNKLNQQGLGQYVKMWRK